MKTDNIPLPASGGKSLDRAGVKTSGYIDKKGTPSGNDVHFNMLPPGMNIEDQKLADIHEMPMKTVVSLSYPGDGWT
jgi:hypothetical protein